MKKKGKTFQIKAKYSKIFIGDDSYELCTFKH